PGARQRSPAAASRRRTTSLRSSAGPSTTASGPNESAQETNPSPRSAGRATSTQPSSPVPITRPSAIEATAHPDPSRDNAPRPPGQPGQRARLDPGLELAHRLLRVALGAGGLRRDEQRRDLLLRELDVGEVVAVLRNAVALVDDPGVGRAHLHRHAEVAEHVL